MLHRFKGYYIWRGLLSEFYGSSKLFFLPFTSPPLSPGDHIPSCLKISADHWNCIAKINYNKQLLPSVPYSLQIALFETFCVCFVYFRGYRTGMDKSSSATFFLCSDIVKGDPSPTWLRKYQEEDEEEAVKRATKKSRTFVLSIFYNFFLFIFFQLLYFIMFFYTFFPHEIYPYTRARPTTHDLYTTHDPRHLATLCAR